MELAAKIRGLIQHEGLLNLPHAAWGALKPLDFHIFAIRRAELLPLPPLPEGVSMHEGALERLRRARAGRHDLPNEFWRDEISGVSQCALLEVGGELAGIVWAYEYPAARPILTLGPGEAELSGWYTIPRFRRRGLSRTLFHFATAWQLRTRPRLFTVGASDNLPPLKAFPVIGYREIVVIRRRSVWGARFSVPQMRVKDLFEPTDPS